MKFEDWRRLDARLKRLDAMRTLVVPSVVSGETVQRLTHLDSSISDTEMDELQALWKKYAG